jgi:hypothetical protein
LKRIVSILFIAIAALVLCVFAVVPHHHHHGIPCFAMERCEQDGHVNDEHTHHHNDADDINHHDHCVLTTGYVLSLTEEVKCKVFSCNHTHYHIHPCPTLCVLTDSPVYDAGISAIKREYGGHLFFYKSSYIGYNSGLRAPPCLLKIES